MTSYSATTVSAPRRQTDVLPISQLASAMEPHPFYDASKRTMDVLLGGFFLFLAAPVVILSACVIMLTARSNPFFIQQRVGHCGQTFRLIKLKTMRDGAHSAVPRELDETMGPTFKSRTDPRVTGCGSLIRRASIDELPQLVNVVLGQMSLVGPRPPLAEEVVHYTRPQLERLTVKPGLTGIWQVSGRSTVPFRTWMAMDRVYVRRRSLVLDLGLLVRTPWAVLSMRGAF